MNSLRYTDPKCKCNNRMLDFDFRMHRKYFNIEEKILYGKELALALQKNITESMDIFCFLSFVSIMNDILCFYDPKCNYVLENILNGLITNFNRKVSYPHLNTLS
ncbi:unnamed protein product [Trifolium pratense]|uniref:Uncharacterized protein n=1 Tax=Trifolium pratense TaxID=57577 RepID=A0ACB0J0L2_TRIPR|nr:unnamed protein product [Trifolium pratense]